MNNNLENYLNYKAKFDRMQSIIGKYSMEIKAEGMGPLIDDGFDLEDIIGYFTIELNSYANRKKESKYGN